MRRREFITLMAAALVEGRPLAALAQRPDRVIRIGVFAFGAESDSSAQLYVRALRQGLGCCGGTGGAGFGLSPGSGRVTTGGGDCLAQCNAICSKSVFASCLPIRARAR